MGTASADDHRARAFANEGTRLYQAKQYLRAADLFHQAFRIDPNPRLLFNAARSEERAKAAGAALQSYTRFLQVWPDAPNAARVRASIDRLEADASKTHTRVTFTAVPADAALKVTEKHTWSGAGPLTVWLAHGDVKVEAIAAEHLPLARTVTVTPTTEQAVRLTLTRADAPGRLTITGVPDDAELALDGRLIAIRPIPKELEVAPGSHVVKVTSADHEPFEHTVKVAPAGRAAVVVRLGRREAPAVAAAKVAPPPEEGFVVSGLAWGLIGVTAVGVVAGGVAAALALDEAAGARSAETTDDWIAHKEAAERNLMIGYIGWGVAAAGAIGATVVMVLDNTGGPAAFVIPMRDGAIATLKFGF